MSDLVDLAPGMALLPASENPLSADVIVLTLSGCVWIYDVGASDRAAEVVNGLPGPKFAVLSHFHADHAGNLPRVSVTGVYAGAFTCRRLGAGVPVTERRDFPGGVSLFPVPSSHAKGCLGLEYGGIALLGDACCAAMRDGVPVYNAGVLRELILTLRGLRADKLALSHSDPVFHPRREVLDMLEAVYAKRRKDSPYIQVE